MHTAAMLRNRKIIVVTSLTSARAPQGVDPALAGEDCEVHEDAGTGATELTTHVHLDRLFDWGCARCRVRRLEMR
jgi:hypothetical protein